MKCEGKSSVPKIEVNFAAQVHNIQFYANNKFQANTTTPFLQTVCVFYIFSVYSTRFAAAKQSKSLLAPADTTHPNLRRLYAKKRQNSSFFITKMRIDGVF